VDSHTQRVLSLCAGYGGLELALQLAGVATRTVCYVEREVYPAANLAALMEEGHVDSAPIWDDLATFDARPWRGVVEIVTAGFPCQPVAAPGQRKHTTDERWLWPDIDRILRDVEPGVVFLENSPRLLVSDGMGEVLGTLADLGFRVEWTVCRASEVGACHDRARLFIVAAHPDFISLWHERGRRCRESGKGSLLLGADGQERDASWPPKRLSEPRVDRAGDGPSHGLVRHSLLGNGVVPAQGGAAFRYLWERMT